MLVKGATDSTEQFIQVTRRLPDTNLPVKIPSIIFIKRIVQQSVK